MQRLYRTVFCIFHLISPNVYILYNGSTISKTLTLVLCIFQWYFITKNCGLCKHHLNQHTELFHHYKISLMLPFIVMCITSSTSLTPGDHCPVLLCNFISLRMLYKWNLPLSGNFSTHYKAFVIHPSCCVYQYIVHSFAVLQKHLPVKDILVVSSFDLLQSCYEHPCAWDGYKYCMDINFHLSAINAPGYNR